MGIYMDKDEQERAEALAERLGTSIPQDIGAILWALPLLEVIVEKVERIEDLSLRVKGLEKALRRCL